MRSSAFSCPGTLAKRLYLPAALSVVPPRENRCDNTTFPRACQRGTVGERQARVCRRLNPISSKHEPQGWFLPPQGGAGAEGARDMLCPHMRVPHPELSNQSSCLCPGQLATGPGRHRHTHTLRHTDTLSPPHIHTHIHTLSPHAEPHTWAHMYTYTQSQAHTHIHTQIHTQTHTDPHRHTQIHAHTP